MAPRRRTFVIDVRDPDGPADLHEVRTGRRVRLGSLREMPGQIERWVRDAVPPGTTRRRDSR